VKESKRINLFLESDSPEEDSPGDFPESKIFVVNEKGVAICRKRTFGLRKRGYT